MKTFLSPIRGPIAGRLSSMLCRLALASVLTASATASLSAGTISYSSALLPVPAVPGNWSQSTSVPKFDSTLGTLTKVTYSIDGSVVGDLALENLDAVSKSGTAALQATFTLSDTVPTTLFTFLLKTPTVPFTLDAFNGDGGPIFPPSPKFEGPDTIFFSALSGSGSFSLSDTAPATLALFTGTGNIDLKAAAKTQGFNSASGNFASSSTATAKAKFTVAYEYSTGVPDVGSTAPLLGATFGLFVVFSRRSRK